jgi:pimeloyl-ACP methyl ester carboxylesterase
MANLHLLSDSEKLGNTHIIFIHGLGGNETDTWSSRESKSGFWPLWLSEDNGDVNIWSIGYSAPKLTFTDEGMGLIDHATNIFERLLKTEELLEGEIIFICHSLGGLIVKQILRIANEQVKRAPAQEFIGRVSGVAFIATPHLGADIALLGNNPISRLLLRGVTTLSPSAATASLSRNDPNLRALNTWYREWSYHSYIRHLVLIETQKLYGLLQVVKPDSADPGFVEARPIPIQANHETICKPIDKSDDIYIQVNSFITQKKRDNHEIWLTSRFSSAVNSWEGYGNWAKCPLGVSEEYLLDEKIRLLDSSSKDGEGLSGIDSLHILRQQLLKNKSSTRLVGLSGVGKTRFVQALFDKRIGINPIPTDNVFYTDIANGPTPSPRVLAEKLVSEAKYAQLIVDNCPPELHRILTSICTSDDSKVSLLTIEYDIREDQPEQTDVFSLEPSSLELIEKIIKNRYRHISQQNSKSIAEFSGGNSRIAIALAETIKKDENISSFKDDELFKRLFYQRHEKEQILEKVAQVLSLVYSFQIDSDDEYTSDLTFLSHLSHTPRENVFECAQELKRRNLTQQRNVWMAVLPHPIANRLAKLALQNTSRSIILNNFIETLDQRLLKSFSRRLGYLTDSKEALLIIEGWLSEEGLINKLHSRGRDELAWTLLINIAPISAVQVLRHIDKLVEKTDNTDFLTSKNQHYVKITTLLRSLAYHSKYFDQCLKLLCQFAISEGKGENYNSIINMVKSLFQLYLSGTHASKEQRLNIIDGLFKVNSIETRELAIELLGSSLEASHFSSDQSFDFGANSRDFGYHPKTNEEVKDWYTQFINYTARLITSNSDSSDGAKLILSNNLRSLWEHSNLRGFIEKTCQIIRSSGEWNNGYSAIHSILKFDCKSQSESEIERLKAIAEILSPKSIEDKLYMYVLADKWDFYELEEPDEAGEVNDRGYVKGQEYAEKLGFKIASTDIKYLISMLPVLLSYKGMSSNLFEFGIGSASGLKDVETLLSLIVLALEPLDVKDRNIDFLCGIIHSLSSSDPELTGRFLDTLIIHPTLKQHFPFVQFSYPIDSIAIERIIQSIKNQTSPSWVFGNIASGRRHESIPDEKLCEILDLIWNQPDGQKVVIHILVMRFHGLKQNKTYQVTEILKKKSASFLGDFDYSKENTKNDGLDYDLTQIAKVCFSENIPKECAYSIFGNIRDAIVSHIIGRTDFPEFLSTMIQLEPILALDVFIGGEIKADYRLKDALRGRFDKKFSPFSRIEATSILSWCNIQPEQRFPVFASLITPHQTTENSTKWTPLAIELINNAPDPIKVLNEFSSNLHPMSWSGSRAKILEKHLPLFKHLKVNSDIKIASWAIEKEIVWEKNIAREYENEDEKDIDRDERFEW